MLFKLDFLNLFIINNIIIFSWWLLLLYEICKCRMRSWDLKKLLLKVMLKSTWLNLVLNVNFMNLNILKLEFFHFLEFIIYLRLSSQNFVENHQFKWNLLYFFLKIVDYHLLAHHLHCHLQYVDFSWNFSSHHK